MSEANFLYSNLTTQIGRVIYSITHDLISIHIYYSVGTYDLDKVKGSINETIIDSKIIK